MTLWTKAAAAAALAGGLVAAGGAQADPAYGLWLVESKRAIVEIGPCGDDQACGKIVWLAEPNDAAGKPKLDAENPDAAKQARPICGLEMIGGFSKDAAGKWSGGKIYDASEGKTYNAKMAVQGDGSLDVRGFIGISLIGKTQTWTKAADDRGGC